MDGGIKMSERIMIGGIEYLNEPQGEWWEVKYTDEETLEDYSTDVKANTPEEAQQIFESQSKPQYKVWAVYGK